MPTQTPDGNYVETKAELKRRLAKYGATEAYATRRRELEKSGLSKLKTQSVLETEFSSAKLAARGAANTNAVSVDKGAAEQLQPVSQSELDGLGAPTERDCLWVYHNFEDENASAATAPSAGALGMLKAARASVKIYEMVVDRITPKTFASGEIEDNSELFNLTGLDDQIVKAWGHAKAQLLA